jgi:ParB-like chromosome segregation protein Spo0J
MSAKPRFVLDFELSTISPNDANPRTIDDESRAALGSSLARFGNVQTLVVNRPPGARTYRLVSGHQRLREMLAKGEKRAPVTVVALADRDERALALALNGHAGRFDQTQLEGWLLDLAKQGEDITRFGLAGETGYEEARAELAKIGGAEDDPPTPAPQPAKDPISRDADVWELGCHRLVVGKRSLRAADDLVEEWQRASGRDAKLAATGQSFAQVTTERRG